MKSDINIPEHELEISTSRAGGPGGQHVNKTDTKVTIRWNIQNSAVLSAEQKELIIKNLSSRISSDGDLIIHNNESRSQLNNKKAAFKQLTALIIQALHVPVERKVTKVSQAVKEKRLQEKSRVSTLKKLRRTKISYDE